jgi:type IV secretion system protein VirB5
MRRTVYFYSATSRRSRGAMWSIFTPALISVDHSELKRERWTATVTYVFGENVKNNELAVNPLGLTIVRFRADQAFS